MMRKILSITLLMLSVIHLYSNFLTLNEGLWRRDDGSIYQFENDQVYIRIAGLRLQAGQFKENDVQVKDIYEKEGRYYGFLRFNDRNGNISRWELVRFNKINNDNVRVENRAGETVFSLQRISRNDYHAMRDAPRYVEGKWRRSDDGSIYVFEKDIAILERVGHNLERGRFRENQTKLRDINFVSAGSFSALDRLNRQDGSVSNWNRVTISVTGQELLIGSTTSGQVQRFTKVEEQTVQAPVAFNMPPTEPPKQEKIEEVIPPISIESNIPRANRSNHDAIAVIIGNKNYSETSDVEFAIRDAKLVEQYVTQSLGYRSGNIIQAENVTLGGFNSIFGDSNDHRGRLSDYIKEGLSDVFVFYSGHGAPDPNTRKGYLVPTDADPNRLARTGYLIDLLYENLGKLNARSITVVIDACFSGTSGDGHMLIENISPVGIQIDEPSVQVTNATIITASSESQVAHWYPEKRHGMLTYFFLKALQGDADYNQDGKISVAELRRYLTDNSNGLPYYVRRLHSRDQTPQVWGRDDTVLR